EALRACPGLEAASDDLLWEAKQHGFSDRQLAFLWDTDDMLVRQHRKSRGIEAVFKLVDTCAAEFEAYTPYYYSTYERPAACGLASATPQAAEDETRPAKDGKERIIILGGRPNRLGQGIEFAYRCR